MHIGITNPADNRFAYSSIWQYVTIPAEAGTATLDAWIYPRRSGWYGSAAQPPLPAGIRLDREESRLHNDAQYILLYDQNDRQHVLLYTLLDSQTWERYAFDLSAFAGQTVKLYFGVLNNGYGWVTAMVVDDVSLEVCADW